MYLPCRQATDLYSKLRCIVPSNTFFLLKANIFCLVKVAKLTSKDSFSSSHQTSTTWTCVPSWSLKKPHLKICHWGVLEFSRKIIWIWLWATFQIKLFLWRNIEYILTVLKMQKKEALYHRQPICLLDIPNNTLYTPGST